MVFQNLRSKSNLGYFIEDKNTLGPVDAALFQSLRREVKNVLNTLTERENRVLQL